MAPLTRGVGLLESAISYGLAGAALVTPELLERSTPCLGWDLEMLLRHISDSLDVLNEAIVTEHIEDGYAQSPCWPEADALSVLRRRAAKLLGACSSAGASSRCVTIGERELATSKVAVAGAMEVTVHGWDIWAACGAFRPIPPLLAAVLLPVAPLLVTPDVRPGLFADPVQLAGPACPSDQLVALLGREPGWMGPRDSS
jgi:uncharacterized protein (TIGR03086 family)